jgi:hypothetical protein
VFSQTGVYVSAMKRKFNGRGNMKKIKNENSLSGFAFIISILLSVEGAAQQCSQLFVESKPGLSNYLELVDQIKNATSNIDRDLSENYALTKSAQKNNDRNLAVLNIMELNNHALEIFDGILSMRSFFKSTTERMFQNGLADNIFAVFRKQGFTKDQIKAILDSRLALNNRLEAENQQPQNPIGFIRPQEKLAMDGPTQRTIGFNQQERLDRPYGRTQKQRESSSESSSVRVKSPIGFIHSKTESTAEPLKSIGFVQPQNKIDVTYSIQLGFDLDNATFITVSGQRAIGFIN